MIIKALYRYPVKSLGRESLQTAVLTEYGIEHDRSWMIVDDTDKFMTQRELPMLTSLSAKVENNQCIIFNYQNPDINCAFEVTKHSDNKIATNVWKSKVVANEVSNEASAWLSDTMNKSLRIVTSGNAFNRTKRIPGKALQLRFADGYPILVLSQASVDFLNCKLAQPVDESRFRANILIDGVNAHAEDSSRVLKVEDAEITMIKPCNRCIMINTDQISGKLSQEPLKTLSEYRKFGNNIHFAMNAYASKEGTINVNEKAQLLE